MKIFSDDNLIFRNCFMLTRCQKLDSLLTMSYMHEFIKKTKLNMSFLGLNDQNMYALEAQICIYCAKICIRQDILFWPPSWMSILILKPRNNNLCYI